MQKARVLSRILLMQLVMVGYGICLVGMFTISLGYLAVYTLYRHFKILYPRVAPPFFD